VEYLESDIKKIHKLCIGNEQSLLQASMAGCFCCLKIFDPCTIDDWIDDKPIRSACCPHCGIDAVLAEDESLDLTAKLLKAMKAHYFDKSVDWPWWWTNDCLKSHIMSTLELVK
jgi:hypothetical protein